MPGPPGELSLLRGLPGDSGLQEEPSPLVGLLGDSGSPILNSSFRTQGPKMVVNFQSILEEFIPDSLPLESCLELELGVPEPKQTKAERDCQAILEDFLQRKIPPVRWWKTLSNLTSCQRLVPAPK